MSDLHFDAVVFDLDGVITRTALVHSRAWKKMFDGFLMDWSARHGQAFSEFRHDPDYLSYVDGKPRYDGVKSFLESRGIKLPFGDPSDEPAKESVCGLGNRKNEAFNEVLAREGVGVYESTVRLMKALRDLGIRVGVASSSKNCEAVLNAAGLDYLVETRVDGVVSAELGLKGKPEPDIFLTAAKNLGAKPNRTAVVEDASSGVSAGRQGNFGLVLGIAREENEQELLLNGADLVVRDLEEVDAAFLEAWFTRGLEEDSWSLTYYGYEPAKEKSRESLLAVGNGCFAARGALEEQKASASHYPGTYMAGLYNRLVTPISGKDIENEDFVNIPSFFGITFRIDGGPWFDIDRAKVLSMKRRLDFRSGLLSREMTVKDGLGRVSRIVSERLVSMENPFLAVIRYTLTPENYSGRVEMQTTLDGTHINAGVERYKSLNQQHLKPAEQGSDAGGQYLLVKTTQSGTAIALASVAEVRSPRQSFLLRNHAEPGLVETGVTYDALQGEPVLLTKRIAVCASHHGHADPLTVVRSQLRTEISFDEMLRSNRQHWASLWLEIDVVIGGNRLSQKLVRLHLYHLLISMSPHNARLDAGITARGLHGEAYRGHIFWDEIFVVPLYCLHLPDVARSMLMYRYRRLEAARKYAREHGYLGAMFPWQSGSDGREETQVIHLNPLSGQWDPDHSCLQRHVSLAIAYNVWMYYQITGDRDFIRDHGAEIFLEIARFWTSKAEFNEDRGRYDIPGVMGPDEFHESYPGAAEGGLKNNAYTNLMTAWLLQEVPRMLEICGPAGTELAQRIGLSAEELGTMAGIAENLYVETTDAGIIAQFEGYFGLKELDWEAYRAKYGNIYRLDRILKAEGKSPDEYKLAKQADTLMIFYNFDPERVERVLKALRIDLPAGYLQKNLAYYMARTSHGSTLSRLVHGRLALLAGDRDLSWRLYADALASDFTDIQGGTTAEGIHSGVMAGTVYLAVSTFAGVDPSGEVLRIDPQLPDAWESIRFSLKHRNIKYSFLVGHDFIEAEAEAHAEICFRGNRVALEPKIRLRLSV